VVCDFIRKYETNKIIRHNKYKCNVEARSCSHNCSGKSISITYAEYVLVALVTHHIVTFGLSECTTFFNIALQMARFSRKKKSYWLCLFWFSLQLLSEIFLILRRIQPNIIINVYRSLRNEAVRYYHISMKLALSGHIFEKYSNIQFNENPSSGSRVDPWGRKNLQEEANDRFSLFCKCA
jgi:hypothetical protein